MLVVSARPFRVHWPYLYGIWISVIDELPAGRQTIKNCVVDPGYRPKAYAFIELGGGGHGGLMLSVPW